MTYPDNFLRGVSNKDFITDDGISGAAFQFDDRQIRNGWMEQSICWEDDNSVIDLMLGQKNEKDEIQFKAGIARVTRHCIAYINNLPASRDILSYERNAHQGNPYHGNLLLRENASKAKRSQIAGTIALHVSNFIPR